MSAPHKNNIGGYVAARSSLPPVAAVAGTRTGTSVDRLGFASCVIVHSCAAVAGAPTTQAIDLKLQDSDDGSAFADVAGYAFAQKTTGTAELRELDLNLAKARRFVRLVEVVAFTGGTTPSVVSAPVIILGGADRLVAV